MTVFKASLKILTGTGFYMRSNHCSNASKIRSPGRNTSPALAWTRVRCSANENNLYRRESWTLISYVSPNYRPNWGIDTYAAVAMKVSIARALVQNAITAVKSAEKTSTSSNRSTMRETAYSMIMVIAGNIVARQLRKMVMKMWMRFSLYGTSSVSGSGVCTTSANGTLYLHLISQTNLYTPAKAFVQTW